MSAADIVFHLASALGGSLIDRREFFRINAEGTEAVLEAARKAGVPRIVHFSSAGVLGSVRDGDVADEGYPARPVLAYDHAKLAGEKAALKAAAEGMDIVIVRPGWAYGPGDRRTFKLIRMVVSGPRVMAAKAAARQTPVHINDLVKGVRLAADRGRKGEIYHLAGAEILTAGEIVRAIASAAGRRPPRLRLPGWLAQTGRRHPGGRLPAAPQGSAAQPVKAQLLRSLQAAVDRQSPARARICAGHRFRGRHPDDPGLVPAERLALNPVSAQYSFSS